MRERIREIGGESEGDRGRLERKRKREKDKEREKRIQNSQIKSD